MNSTQHTAMRKAVLSAVDAMKHDKIDKLGAFIDALHDGGFRMEPLAPMLDLDAVRAAAQAQHAVAVLHGEVIA